MNPAAAAKKSKYSQSYRRCMLHVMGVCFNTRKKQYLETVVDPVTGEEKTRERKLSFIGVPRDESVRRKYMKRLCWDPAVPFPKDAYLCDLHFDEMDLTADRLGRKSLLNEQYSLPKPIDVHSVDVSFRVAPTRGDPVSISFGGDSVPGQASTFATISRRGASSPGASTVPSQPHVSQLMRGVPSLQGCQVELIFDSEGAETF
jgi:hypothetical protein